MKKGISRWMMKVGINKSHVIGIVVALIIILIDISLKFSFEMKNDIFYFLLIMAFIIAALPFFISLIIESNITRRKDEMFLEFTRDLVESVKAGTPISKSIINITSKDYDSLSPYVSKLANQISIGIPLKTAFETFARDINSKTITRAVMIISESEKAGGKIDVILESVAKSVTQTDKLRKERRAAIYTLVVQGYIIFMIFILIMLVMEFKILPIASGLGTDMGDVGSANIAGSLSGFFSGEKASPEELARPFIWLLVVQGLFAGLVIGKLSEGTVKSGLKHSFILVVLALILNQGAKLLFSGG